MLFIFLFLDSPLVFLLLPFSFYLKVQYKKNEYHKNKCILYSTSYCNTISDCNCSIASFQCNPSFNPQFLIFKYFKHNLLIYFHSTEYIAILFLTLDLIIFEISNLFKSSSLINPININQM